METDDSSNGAETALKRYNPDVAIPAWLELYQNDDFTSLYMNIAVADPETPHIPSTEQVVAVLESVGVKKFDIESIKRACAAGPAEQPALIATGQPPRHGVPARIEYKFHTEDKKTVEYSEDDFGRVDFRNVDSIHQASKGDVVAEVIPPQPGEPGEDVFGNIVEARAGAQMTLEGRIGPNVTLDDDGVHAIAACDGMVKIENSKIIVSPVYKINGDVDFETGNIDFRGDVIVNGFVREDFSVKADGSVTVEQNIERATVESGCNVMVKGGILGKEGVRVVAGNSITAAYADNALMEAKQSITLTTEMIHSVARARKVLLHAGRGAVLGGEIHALEYINVKTTADPDSGIRTLIEIERDPEIMRQINEIKDQIKPIREKYQKARPTCERLIDYKEKQGGKLSPKAERDLETLRGILHELGEKETELNFEIAALESQLVKAADAKIIVQDKLYPGTELVIFDTSLKVREPMQGGTFMLVNGEIKQVKTR